MSLIDDMARLSNHLHNLPVIENLLATRTVPIKAHKKRRHQSMAYHRRVQKKWTKRHGTKQVPAAYMMENRFIGGSGRTLLVHPAISMTLKASMNQVAI